jgi:hypothetical protein
LGGQSYGAKVFTGGFEEDYLRVACHNSPLIVCKIRGCSTKRNVRFRKIAFITPQKPTT